MGGPVGAATGVPFRVKAHGSELEYSMRGRPELEAWGARRSRTPRRPTSARAHIREVLEDVVGHVDRVYEVPPGVDVDEFVLRGPRRGARGAARGGARRPAEPGQRDERLPDEGNAERLAAFLAGDEPTVVYFGKLIEQKGVQVLLEAMRDVDARARRRRLRPVPRDARGDGAASARSSPARSSTATSCTCCRSPTSTVVPSIFPEAFGMVAAEAAAAGSPPLVARHSGLAEVAAGLEEEYPERFRHLASFETGDAADLARKLDERCSRSRAADRDELRRAARQAVVERWSWAERRATSPCSRSDAARLRSRDGRGAAASPGRSCSRRRARRSRAAPTSPSPSRRSSRCSTPRRSS